MLELSNALFDRFLGNSSLNYGICFGQELTKVYYEQNVDLIKQGMSRISLTKTWLTGFLYLMTLTPIFHQRNVKFVQLYNEPERIIYLTEPDKVSEDIPEEHKVVHIFLFSLVDNAFPNPMITSTLFEKMIQNADLHNSAGMIRQALKRARFITSRRDNNEKRIFETSELPVVVSTEYSSLIFANGYRIIRNAAGLTMMEHLKSGRTTLHDLLLQATHSVRKLFIPVDPPHVFAFTLGGMANFLKVLHLKTSIYIRPSVIESVTFVAECRNGVISRFGKPVRLQICYRSDKEPDFFTAHSFVHVMNLKPIRNIQSGEETLEVFLSYSEVVPLESMFVHNVDQITDDKEKFEALLISNISRLKRIFGDRCAEYYFLSHFLASQPNQGYVMRYKPRGANGAVTSLMHINSRKNAFVLNVAAPGVLHNTDVCLEQLFLERFWRETLNAEKAKNLYVYNLEVSQREATFRVAEFGWTKIYKVVPYTDNSNKFKGQLTFKKRQVSNDMDWIEAYKQDGDIVSKHVVNVQQFFPESDILRLKQIYSTIVGNVFSFANVLGFTVNDIIFGQALLDPILATKVHLFYPTVPMKSMLTGFRLPQCVDVAIIRRFDETMENNDSTWKYFWHRLIFMTSQQSLNKATELTLKDYLEDENKVLDLPQTPNPNLIKMTSYEPTSKYCFSHSISFCSTHDEQESYSDQ